MSFSTEKNPIQHASPPEVVHTEQAIGQRQRILGEFYSNWVKNLIVTKQLTNH